MGSAQPFARAYEEVILSTTRANAHEDSGVSLRRNIFTADLIREARKRKGYSQNELARRIGVREHDIYRWEKGTEPSRAGALRLIKELGISIDEMIAAFDKHDLTRESHKPF